MHEDIMKKLYDKFILSTRQGQGGMTFKYVPNEDVINRMNEVFNGDWSTFVKFRDVVDDQVILEVEVKVVDPDNGRSHSHTGFGSQQIMRYKSGPNANQIIDIGNGYKGALAKAIVNACTRWGVGLFKESNPMNEVGLPETPSMPAIPPAIVAPEIPAPAMPAPVSVPTVPMPVMPTTTAAPQAPLPPTSASPTPSPYTVETTAPAEVVVPAVPMPPLVEPPVVVENTTTFPPPLASEQPVSAHINLTQEAGPEMPKIPAPAVNTVPVTPDLPLSKDEGLDGIRISDVQKVALNGILTMNNAEYAPLAEEAFAANNINKPVPNREDLNYEEAVVVIKFGNDKYRKNR